MTAELTLATVGGAVLTEGVKFLYGQATEILKRWRDKQDQSTDAEEKTVPVAETPPQIFAGELAPLEIHLENVEPLQDQLRNLWISLAVYAQGVERVNTQDLSLLEIVDDLRRTLEAIYLQRLTFVGEQRSASGPVADGEINVKQVAGLAVGIGCFLAAHEEKDGKQDGDRIEALHAYSFIGCKEDSMR
jgi:hypothetical protein